MKIEITVSPIFWFQLNLTQVVLLCTLSESHYDHTCRQASARGGFLYGWRNMLQCEADNPESINSDVPYMCRADFHQLDICMKIMEMPPSGSNHVNETVADLRNWFRKATDKVSRENLSVDNQPLFAFKWEVV